MSIFLQVYNIIRVIIRYTSVQAKLTDTGEYSVYGG